MIRDALGNIIEKGSVVAYSLGTGNMALAKVDHVPAGIIGEPPFVLININQIPIPVQNGLAGGILLVSKPEEPKLIEE
jgi:hypothetical protein